MIALNPKRQKSARKHLDGLYDNPQNVFVVHYSCESFYDREDGRSPRITSIALRNLVSAQTKSFSIHQTAEINGIAMDEIENHYDELEQEMLNGFFDHLSNFQNMHFIHWNMRDSNYGFQAIEHRFRTLCKGKNAPYVVRDELKTDLSRLLQDIYGLDYIGHPRLEQLICKNNIVRRDFLSGAKEAKAFEEQEFALLHLSTLRKVDIIGNIASITYDRRLKTNTTWWGMRGGSITTFLNWLGEHPFTAVIGFLVSIVSFGFMIVSIIKNAISD